MPSSGSSRGADEFGTRTVASNQMLDGIAERANELLREQVGEMIAATGDGAFRWFSRSVCGWNPLLSQPPQEFAGEDLKRFGAGGAGVVQSDGFRLHRGFGELDDFDRRIEASELSPS